MNKTDFHCAYLSIGSNLGDKLANCQYGIDRLPLADNLSITAISPVYRTAPVDYLDQDWFVNAAIAIETRLIPAELLTHIKRIEHLAGREPTALRFGPRQLDIDIIFYDDRIIDQPRLQIPHPRMHLRRFVLQPLSDIAPTRMHPVLQCSVAALRDALVDDSQIVQQIEPKAAMNF